MTIKEKIALAEIRNLKNKIERALINTNMSLYPANKVVMVSYYLGMINIKVIDFPTTSIYKQEMLIDWSVEYEFYIKNKIFKDFVIMPREEVETIEAKQH